MNTKACMGVVVTLALAMAAGAAPTTNETVHQKLSGDQLHTGDGAKAIAKGVMEAKKVNGAESDGGQVARFKGDMPQWGFVTAWFGVPAPAGKSVVRLRVYVDDQKTARCMLYTRDKSGQSGIGVLKVPADAKPNTFVSVDVPVTAAGEWSGLTIKKADKSDLPGPWIDTVSIVLPGE
jgi:hypothetical protein